LNKVFTSKVKVKEIKKVTVLMWYLYSANALKQQQQQLSNPLRLQRKRRVDPLKG